MKPAKILLRSDRDRAQACKWVNAAPSGYTLLFKPPTRSNVASARMWALLDDVAAQKEWEGKKRTSDDWKDLFSACLHHQEIVRGLEGGIVAFGSRTSEFSPETMSDMITLIEAWGASNGVIFTDTPQDNHAGTAFRSDGSSPAPAASPLAGGPREDGNESALARPSSPMESAQ